MTNVAKTTGLPKTVQVYHREWKVVVRGGMEEEGLCSPETREIFINKNYPIEVQRSTLFHEQIHACLYEGGITHILSTDQEEGVVTCIENGLFLQLGWLK